MSKSVWPDSEDIRSCEANCLTCAFMYRNGKTPYCALLRFPILNPKVGCSRRMVSSEIGRKTVPTKYITAEEIDAAKIARAHNRYVGNPINPKVRGSECNDWEI